LPLDDYRKDVLDVQNDLTISRPKISFHPKRPRQVPTIVLIRRIIQPFTVRTDAILDLLGQSLKYASCAYVGHGQNKINAIMPGG
jgi:hypothetical protein